MDSNLCFEEEKNRYTQSSIVSDNNNNNNKKLSSKVSIVETACSCTIIPNPTTTIIPTSRVGVYWLKTIIFHIFNYFQLNKKKASSLFKNSSTLAELAAIAIVYLLFLITNIYLFNMFL